jgi:hypothetical protein
MKILMAYEHYPCSIGRFWKRAFKRLGHDVYSTGHCTYGKIGWGPQYDLTRWADKPEFELANFSNRYDIGEATYFLARDFDLWINVDAAHYWRGKLPIPKVVIGSDPHCIGYDEQRQDCDLFVCMQLCYSKAGDTWLPYASDEDWHHRRTDVPLDHDVTFWGVMYDERRRDLAAMERSGLRVVSGTGNVFDECVPDYCSGHVAYCRPSLRDLPARFFEAMAYGCIPLITAVPDLAWFSDLRAGWHYETFSDTGDVVAAARRALDDPRLEERKAACVEAALMHRWTHRAQALLDACVGKGLL